MEKSKSTHSIVSQRFTTLFVSGIIIIGLLVLIGWFSGLMFLTRFSINEVPMAPSTAYVFICLAIGVWFHLRSQKITVNRNISIATATIVISLSCLVFATNIFKYYGNWEHAFIKIPETHLSMQLGHMSLVTALLFIISGFALLFLLGNRRIYKTFSIILTLIIFMLSFILLLGYGFGASFFYFESFIPPAVLTVLSFFLVSLVLIAASNKDTIILKTIMENSTSAKLLRIFLPVIVAITVIESLIVSKLLPLFNVHPAIGITIMSLMVIVVVVVVVSAIAKGIGKSLDAALNDLKESEDRFRKISENAPVLINSFDEDGQCLFWNKQCDKTFGWTIEEINEHEHAMALFYPDPAVRAEVISTITTDPDGSFREWHPVTKDGKTLSTMWANFSLPNGQVFSMGYNITERKQAEEALKASEQESKRHAHELSERVKEIQCMYEVVESIRTRDTLDELFQDVVELIPPSWHYPEITRGRLVFDGKEYVSETFEETKWNQLADLIINGETRGSIEVYYLEECQEINEGPFMKEERNLINSIARTISEAIERKLVEDALIQSEATIRNKLKAITDPEGDIGTLELSDIIDAEALQSIMENFYQLTGMLGAVLDISGKVLVAVGWQDICTKFHRCNPGSLKNCIESDTILTQGVPEGTFKAYHCKNNMWDIVTPIMVGGRHLGNVFMGQYFLEDELPDYKFFSEQAIKYGFDEKEYLAALDRVPRFSKETVDAGMQFYSKLAKIISSLSFSTIQQSRMLSERKLAEEALARTKDLLSETERLGKIGGWIVDLDTMTQTWTEETYRIHEVDMDFKPDVSKGINFYAPSAKPIIERAFNRTVETGEPFDLELELVTAKGNRIWIHSIGKAQQLDGVTKVVSGSLQDITERKKAEQALKESEAKLNALFTSLTEMVVIHELVLNDAGEAVDYRIIDCNKVFIEVTGISKEDAIGKLASQVYQTNPPPYLEEYARVAQGGAPHEFSTFYPPLDKHLMISVVSPYTGKFATITTDITPMMQIQETIMAKNKEMENYLYVASHDLRTPLVNIQGFSQRLKKQADSIKSLFADKTLEPEIRHQLGIIIDEAIPKTLSFVLGNIEKMDSLINGLLRLSRTGRLEMNIQKVEMNALFAKILKSLDFQIKEAQCEIQINALPECYGDAALLDQLFANIISNAIKYADSERTLEVTVEAKNKHNSVVYTVRDTGKGIAQKHLDKIWDVFFRIDPRSDKTGEGIGLSLVKRIVEKHKGKVWIESEENKGSVFYVELQNSIFTEI